ncbi:MAG: glycosyltransferase [Patescibacteria group bacterium]
MKICYFGIYNPKYSRNRVIIKGLKENGIEVIECSSNLSGLRKYFDLIKKHKKIKKDYDLMIVGFPSNQAAFLAKFLTRKPVIADAFVSFYDSMIFDRKNHSPRSLPALYYWFLDWLPARFSDLVLLDTRVHINYFVRTFGIREEKFERVLVGTDESEIYFDPALKKKLDYFLVHYHASFLPLQGTEYIIKAAKILEKENIRFNIIGSGPEYNKIIKLAQSLETNNTEFIKPVPYEKLRQYISVADICLGIFGQTPKTSRVIPNKIYEAIACGKAVITADEPAIHEVFTDGSNIVLCHSADPKDLAEKILFLRDHQALRQRIADSAYEFFLYKLTPRVIVEQLIKRLKKEFLNDKARENV